MANTKISALTASTTPLAGTEVLPIVQSGATKQVSVANLTAGRAVSAASLALTTTPLPVSSGGTGLATVTSNYVPYGNGTGALNLSANLQFDGSNFGVGEAPVSGYRAAIDGDIWVGNTGGVVIGTILNDGGWFTFASSVNVNGARVKGPTEVRTMIGSTDVTRTQATAFFPATNNATQLGIGGLRWSEVFAVNGTINTSDERLKEQAADLTEQEKRVAVRLKGLIKTFKFKDSVLKKGDAARKHIGIMAQSVKDAFAAEGLNAEEYGIFCYDEWDAEYEDVFVPQTIMDGDEEKTIFVKSGEKKLVKEAGNMYGIRYEQLLAFVIAAI